MLKASVWGRVGGRSILFESIYSAMIPISNYIGEAVPKALVGRAQWGLVGNGEEKTNAVGNSNTVESDDDGDAQDIILTPEESDSEDYSALEEASVDSATTMSAYTHEGIEVARRIWAQFWSPEYRHFRTQGKTAETVRWPEEVERI